MPQHEDQHHVEDGPQARERNGYAPDEPHENPHDTDADTVLASIEQELTALVERCEQTTAQHARELTQRQAEIDRTIQIAMKRQVEIDRQTAELRGLADQVAKAEAQLTQRKKRLAARLRRRKARLAQRTALAPESDGFNSKAESLEQESVRLKVVRQLVEEQADLTAQHAQSMDELLAKREHASLELVERLSDACGLADRVRDLTEQVREGRLECRESAQRAADAERESADARSALEAARARIAQLEARIEGMSRDTLLLEQRSLRLEENLDAREARLAEREHRVRQESLRLADDQAACDAKLRELGHKLSESERRERARWLDPRTPLATTSMPLPASVRRRPELRLVN